MAYTETTRSRPKADAQHEIIWQTVGVALDATDSGIPATGDYLDNDQSSALNPICQQVRIDPAVHVGRVFVMATWVGLKARSS